MKIKKSAKHFIVKWRLLIKLNRKVAVLFQNQLNRLRVTS